MLPLPNVASSRPRLGPAAALLCLLGALWALAQPLGAVEQRHAALLTIEGVINPLSAQYLDRGLERAERDGAAVAIVKLNTPGGLESSMHEMTVRILASAIPVVVYVAPAGARAASAGMFLTLAGHVAAMAPGTNIGAAHPVAIGPGSTDRALDEKRIEDAAAHARALAELRGRNAEWAGRAVRESVSITVDEALRERVVDLVAADTDELLRKIDGRQVATSAGTVRLETAGLPVVSRPMGVAARLVHRIADPNIAYLLLTLGFLGLVAELIHPGALFPGIAGGICLVLAFTALDVLPTNWGGIVLVVLGIGLVVADAYVGGLGLLAVGGVLAFLLGSLLLFSPGEQPASPAMPVLRVSPWLVGGATVALGSFMVVVLRAATRARRAPVATGIESLIGRVGTAATALSPSGAVGLEGETWTALALGGPIEAGEEVQVVGVEGVTLHVVRH